MKGTVLTKVPRYYVDPLGILCQGFRTHLIRRVKLSIVIPCYNEERTLEALLQRVVNVDLGSVQKEILVVDDGSRDRSRDIALTMVEKYPGLMRVLAQDENRGKGAAIRRGFQEATGDLVVIQDADLEYDPRDFQQMAALFRLPQVDVVFGSRRLLKNPVSSRLYYSGAPLVAALTYALYGARISDQFTCYKMLRRELLTRIPLKTSGFAIDAELIAKLFRLGVRIREVPITYRPRNRAEGKKVRLRDGFQWMWLLLKYRVLPSDQW